MDDTEGFIAVSYLGDDDADSDQVIDTSDVHIMTLELLVESIEVFGSAGDIGDADLLFGEDVSEEGNGFFHVGLALVEIGFFEFSRLFVVDWVEVLETEVLELAFDLADTETVGDGGINLEGLARDALLLLWREMLEGAHVVEAIGELDDDDPDVLGHGEKHLAQVLEVVLFLGATEFDLAEFGDAIDEESDVSAKFLSDFVKGDSGVFGDVVEEASGERLFVHADFSQNLGHME